MHPEALPDLPTTTTLVLGFLGVVLSLPAWALFARGAWRIWRLISSGAASPGRFTHPVRRVALMLLEVFGHTGMFAKPAVAIAHWCVMVGFLFGSIVWFEAYIQTFNPAGGWPWVSQLGAYHLAEEILAVVTVVGICLLIVVRLRAGHRQRSSRFSGSNATAARIIEAIVFTEGAGMLLVKASKIATFGHGSPWTDPVSMQLARLLPASPTLVSCFALLKLLVGMVFLIMVGHNLNWGVAWHRFLAFFTITLKRSDRGQKSLGPLPPMRNAAGDALTLETVADSDTLGVGTLTDAPWKMLLDSVTCTECGRCQELCPAWNTGKPLSPKLLMTSLRDVALDNERYLRDPALFAADTSEAGVDVLGLVGAGKAIEPDVLWACTNCGACVDQCPVDIEHIDHVANLRRFEVLSASQFPTELGGLFKNLEVKGNPWGRNSAERATWIEEARRDGIEVPVFGEDITDFTDTEYLFWVGCAGAFDDAGRATTRAVVELLHTAGVKFAVLSKGETCTGDPARRAGNEFLFQMLAAQNIETLDGVFEGVPQGQRKIITTCPHCFNTLRNEYPDFDGHFDVFHHTQLLNRLVREGLLTPVPRGPENRQPVTYHDPCFLGRHNKIFDPPRELLGATGIDLIEMDRTKNEAFCCGAGGARMFMEEKTGQRINEFRSQQALDTGATTVAVGCPFCNTMMTGGIKNLTDTPAQRPAVRDVATMLRDSILIDGALPTPRTKTFLELPIRPATHTANTSPTTPPRDEPTTPDSGNAGQATRDAEAAPAPGGAVPTPGGAVPTPGGAVPTPGGAVPTPGGAVPTPGGAVPTPGGAVPTPGGAVPTPGGAVPTPGNAVPKPGGAVPTPGSAVPTPGNAVPKPGGAVPKPGGAVPTPGGAVPTPGSAVPTPGSAVPTPGSAVPTPGSAVPTPGSAVPTPGNAVPKPGGAVPTPGGAVPTPGSAVPTPGSAVPTPGNAVPKPGGAVPTPGNAVPTPGNAVPTPGSAVPTPGGAVPKPGSAVPTPGSAVPTPGSAVPKPGSAVPTPGSAVPTPGNAVPKPGGAVPTPGNAVPTPGNAVPTPGSAVPTPGSAVPKPGSAVPTPGSAVPKPGSAVPTPGSAVPTPGNAVPKPGGAVPTPGNAVPTPGNAVPTPGSAVPTPGGAVPKPGSAVPTPGSAVPTPGSAVPKPGSAVPKPGNAVPKPGNAVPKPPMPPA
ncbi:4Fe-4S dicluster domain-containing protein [Corynebacterium uberis]|uniref:(Fe-S)-binding protein n=1 Tax=Corynebacterium uberis TaxID=2883169 RepID=UPI001D0AC683|nr:(Fe-S)-binding protein [Corynebacterium uberis]UDL80171.1 4Fe-4S dicluster domain-containing protein [Corynebacterium uberis]UDL84512.1 4Fe-4S dicluster domain-containing protein [Corynebacterium uberis]